MSSSSEKDIEKRLEEQYTEILAEMMGMPEKEARETAQEMLAQAIKETKEEGTYDQPVGIGKRLLEKIKQNEASGDAMQYYATSKNEGMTDEDFIWWWDLHDLERKMMMKADAMNKMAAFTQHLMGGGEQKERTNIMHKFHPLYGNPEDTAQTQDDNRPLPVELSGRINRYRERRAEEDSENYQRDLEASSSFNALIRQAIRERKL